MKILTRYILREFCIPLFYCMAGFVSIYLLFELFGSFSRLMAAKPGMHAAVAYFAGYFAPYFQWMAPACLMLATLYTMWRFCRNSEVVAMRAGGVGFFAIVKPLLAVAILVACAVAWVNESYMPDRSSWARRFKDARFDAQKMAEANRVLYVNGTRTWQADMPRARRASELSNVKVTIRPPSPPADPAERRERRITAARAVYEGGRWFFYAPRVVDSVKGVETAAKDVPEGAGLLCFPEFDEKPEAMLLENYDWMYMSTDDRFAYLATHPNLEPATRRRYLYDAFAQLVSPLACLVITLFAIPMGVATGRQSVFKGIVGALGMFFAFYALTILCMVLAARGMLAPLPAACIPDLLFFAIGCRLFWKNR
ncbi:MAG: LptF/LptG family permease [Kiritimatiellae bacterium]|nr:LptF/LptG family permease [Kiritimatiellia bacterium]